MEKDVGPSTYLDKYDKSWAFVIGINQYTNASPLDYATNDAKAIAKLLEEKFSFPKENIIALYDENANAEAIRREYLSFVDKEKIGPDDKILVFFAGHGHTERSHRGEVGFLVPADGDPKNLATLIRWDELTRNADLIQAKHMLFLMDACYGGLALQRSTLGTLRFMGDMLRRYSRQVLTAGKADEPVSDGNGTRPEHSIFTSHLLDALEGGASSDEKVITANSIMSYVYNHVSRDQYSHQTPHYGFIQGDGDFVFDTTLLEEIKLKETEGNVSDGCQEGLAGRTDILISTSPHVTIMPQEDKDLIGETKILLAEPSKSIMLNDHVSFYIKELLEATNITNFPIQGGGDYDAEFLERIEKYEKAIVNLQKIVILLAKWGKAEQLKELEVIFRRLSEADKGSAGIVLWLKLGWYPIQILMYSAGIAALFSKNYQALRVVLDTKVNSSSHERVKSPLALVVGSNLSDIHNNFKKIPGLEKRYVPRSEHLFTLLQPSLEDLLFIGRSYEELFDEFESMVALFYAHTNSRGWGPPGRFAWKYSEGYGENPYEILLKEAESEQNNWGPIQAGMFDGSYQKFKVTADLFTENLKKLNWW